MSAVQALATPRFLRKTTLLATEANTNFKMLDEAIGEAITSPEADSVTPLMSKIYTRLLLTPLGMREGERVLRFAGEEREGRWVTAWEQLRAHLRVSSETANKALRWMHGQGIIGYYAGKNGVGIRIFLNRAASSVARRAAPRPQKIFPCAPASVGTPRISSGEVPFKDSFAVSESLDSDFNSVAPKSGAGKSVGGEKFSGSAASHGGVREPGDGGPNGFAPFGGRGVSNGFALEEIVLRLKTELEPALHSAARQAAAREHERTREWLENKGLPKAARVAQHEAYNVLKRYGLFRGPAAGASVAATEAGRNPEPPAGTRPLSDVEIAELAQACVAVLETQGRPVDVTISQMGLDAGGFLSRVDAARVKETADVLLGAGCVGGKGEG